MLKKTGLTIKHKSPFELHELLVASAESDNRLSRKVDNFLGRKFGQETDLLLALTHEAFKAHFDMAFETGEYIAHLWATAVYPRLPVKFKRDLFGSVHMAMHWSGEQSAREKRKAAVQQKKLVDARERLKKSARGRRSLQKEIKRLKNQNSNLNKALAVAKEEKAGLEIIVAELAGRTRQVELEKENRTLGETLAALRNDLDAQHQLIESLRKKNMRLNSEVEQQQHLSRLYGRETRDFIKEVLALNRCDTSCPAFDLCQKRVLIVGGITRMESLYRKVIESSGGVFDYHDGYMKKGIKRLESSLKRADVVLCPVSCNSHAACSAVKSLAKKHNKTVHMLPTSSLSAVSQVIWGTAQGKGTIN